MKISNIALFATLMLGASLPHQAVAQQVISKGSWVLENPQDNFTIGVFPTSDACVAGWHKAQALAAQNIDVVNSDLSNPSQTNVSYYDLLRYKEQALETQVIVAAAACVQQ